MWDGYIYDSDGNLQSKKEHEDVTSITYGFKVGYQHFDKNRVEVSIKDKKINTDIGDMKATTLGIGYEWGFVSLERGNILPYFLGGIDVGQAKLHSFGMQGDKIDTVGFNLGFGIRYSVNSNVDAKIGYIHSNMVFGNFENDKDDITDVIQNKVDFGVTYKF